MKANVIIRGAGWLTLLPLGPMIFFATTCVAQGSSCIVSVHLAVGMNDFLREDTPTTEACGLVAAGCGLIMLVYAGYLKAFALPLSQP